MKKFALILMLLFACGMIGNVVTALVNTDDGSKIQFLEPYLIEKDEYCSDCAVFAPLDDLMDNGNGTGNTTIYVNGEAQIATVYFNETTGYPKLVSGWIGNAFEFDGNNGKLALQNGISPTRDMTISVIVNISDTTSKMLIYSDKYLELAIDDAEIAFGRYNTTWYKIYSTTTLSTNKVYLIVVTYDYTTGNAEIWIGDYETGQLWKDVEGDIGTFELAAETTTEVVGIGWTGAYPFKGKLDELRVYNRIISYNEKQLIFNLGRYKLPLWQGNEVDLPAYLNTTLFCSLDELDTVNNVTKCYLNKEEVNATIYFNETTGYPKLVTGQIGNAFEFDGDKSRVEIGATSNTTVFSVVVWAYPTDLSVDRQIVQGYPRFGIFLKSGGLGVYVHYKDTANTWHTLLVPYTIQTNTWYMITAIYECDVTSNKTTITLYVNDELAGTVTEDGVPQDLQKIIIGSDIGLTVPFVGTIDEVRFYNGKKLSDDEIKLLYYLSRHKTANYDLKFMSETDDYFMYDMNITTPADYYIVPYYTSVIKYADFSDNSFITNRNTAYLYIYKFGINKGLLWFAKQTDDYIWVEGSGNLPINSQFLYFSPKVNKAVNKVRDGINIEIDFDSPKLYPLRYNPYWKDLNGSIDIHFKAVNKNLYDFNVSYIVPNFSFTLDAAPLTNYTLYTEGEEVYSVKTDGTGISLEPMVINSVGSFILATESSRFTYNMMNLATSMMSGLFLLIIVATKITPNVKFDDKYIKIMLTLIAVIVILMIIDYFNM